MCCAMQINYCYNCYSDYMSASLLDCWTILLPADRCRRGFIRNTTNVFFFVDTNTIQRIQFNELILFSNYSFKLGSVTVPPKLICCR